MIAVLLAACAPDRGKADDLCFWERERVQLANLVDGAEGDVPLCI